MLRTKVLSSSAIRAKIVERLSDCVVKLNTDGPLSDDFFKGYRLEFETGGAEVVEWNARDGIARTCDPVPNLPRETLCSFLSPEEPPLLAIRVLTKTRLDESLPPLEMRLATTRATNALLEGKVAKTAFLVTRGFKDLLRIGNQQRPNLFELGIQKSEPLHSLVLEIDERLDSNGAVLIPLGEEQVRVAARRLKEAAVESVAVAFLHSYLNSEHENRVGEILRQEGFARISLSSDLSPMIKFVPRAETTVVDACLAPIMDSYLDAVEAPLRKGALRVMTSAGGLAMRQRFRAKDGLLSGPAGGVVGSSSVAARAGFERSIAFDMGGTSADVSRFDGQLPYQYEHLVGAAHIYAPSLCIETVAAGGGSICWFDGAALRVGPESAGAQPGPACYGAGGPLTLTDVNVLLNRIDGNTFGIPVYAEAARARFGELKQQIVSSATEDVSDESILQGWLTIADERMADAIRKISVRDGYDPAQYAMVAFGGAGGLHACAIADVLGMETVLFPSDAGLLSAYGLSRSKREYFESQQVLEPLEACRMDLEGWRRKLLEKASERLKTDGFEELEAIDETSWLEMRYVGQEASITIELHSDTAPEETFIESFHSQYGFNPSQAIEIVASRVCVYVNFSDASIEKFPSFDESFREKTKSGEIWRDDIEDGEALVGPSAIQDPFCAVYLAEGWQAVKGDQGSLLLKRLVKSIANSTEKSDTIQLELFTNRFLSIVEEMGVLLERSAFSTNVKERRDFSCALLDESGWLIANAPHIPVHLGALGVCVRESIAVQPLEEGDILIVNHPGYGGSHLPDITLVAPVYSDSGERIAYVANRAHHAEIGGISPGSMPPNARNLEEEGVVFEPMLLARGGIIDWGRVENVLAEAKYPTRRLQENLSDLAAQVASIRLGIDLVTCLANAESVYDVVKYLKALRDRSASALRRALSERSIDRSTAIERLDDGAQIQVAVSEDDGKWVIDFAGSAPEQKNNYNASRGIVTSAVIYVLRLLVDEDLPLNEGFLDVVDIRIPEGMLNPDFPASLEKCPPVVAGNVEVSQRIVDTLIKAFGLAACSQGTMNNLIFGNDRFSYYETIAGGEGATPERNGASGVHTHMTNTAITDPEILEKRFPVRLEEFSIREDSGGKGRHPGGDGVIRRMKFLEPVSLSLLTQHRRERPFGLNGGEPGYSGEQILQSVEGAPQDLDGNASIGVSADYVVEIRTPGGGGWDKARDGC